MAPRHRPQIGDHVKIFVRDRRSLLRDLGAIGVLEGDARNPATVSLYDVRAGVLAR